MYWLKPLVHSRAPIWGIGDWAVEAWRAEFGDDRHYFNIPYFSDLSRFSRPPETKRTPGVRTILFSGALIHRKGVDLLARAFVRVARDAPHLRLELLGSGGLKSRVESEVEACADQVRFLGFKHWSELPAVYHSADVLCAPSRYDGWGMIVPEGLAAGLPVISTDCTGAAIELIENGVNGWIIATDDECGLEQALRTVAELTDAQLDKISQAAISTARHHSLQHGVNRFFEAVNGSLAAFN
jgi:glycosyltransferase involved in cell wall biosynthesis